MDNTGKIYVADTGNDTIRVGVETPVAPSPGGIGFDDLPSSTTGGFPIPLGYGGLNWSNFFVVNGIGFAQSYPSGYGAGAVSVSNVVYNDYGNAASITSGSAFNFISAYLTAGWNDNLQLEVLGYSGLTLTYSNIYTLSATNPTLINFNYFGVNEVYFATFGGTPHPGYISNGENFAMDNVTVSINSVLTLQFTANPNSGTTPLIVQFNSPAIDSGGHGIVHWNWNFGDGSTSADQNPSHTYTAVRTFHPSLLATNDNDGAVIGMPDHYSRHFAPSIARSS